MAKSQPDRGRWTRDTGAAPAGDRRAGLERDERLDRLAPLGIGHPDHGHLPDRREGVQQILFQTSGPGRDIWIHEIDDISQVDEQVFETQLPFTRPEPTPA